MANAADAIIDRRRLRRKLTFWRAFTLLLIALALISLYFFNSSEKFSGKSAPHIAKVRVEGTIFENDELLKRLKDVEDSAAVKGVITPSPWTP